MAEIVRYVYHHHHVRLLKSCHNATCTWKEIMEVQIMEQ